jgi:hypothetical protein
MRGLADLSVHGEREVRLRVRFVRTVARSIGQTQPDIKLR